MRSVSALRSKRHERGALSDERLSLRLPVVSPPGSRTSCLAHGVQPLDEVLSAWHQVVGTTHDDDVGARALEIERKVYSTQLRASARQTDGALKFQLNSVAQQSL
jgi:hypothetical protein